MKKWIICRYGFHNIQSEAVPIGVAIQKTYEDSTESTGFIEITRFSEWLSKNNLCAYSDNHKYHFPCLQIDSLPILYK